MKKEVEVDRMNEELKRKKIECELRMSKCREIERELNKKKEQVCSFYFHIHTNTFRMRVVLLNWASTRFRRHYY